MENTTKNTLKEKIAKILKDSTDTEGRYTGGGDEPSIIVFTNSEDSDHDSFVNMIAEQIANEIISE